ncbi:hypothetical protein AB1K83_00610 [Sporosarcina sp. 179-K 3D1 HS]
MKGRFLAIPLAALLVLSACGGERDAEHFKVDDPTFEDDGQNDVGT